MQTTEQLTESYTVTKYDAAKQMSERRRSVPLYWFDMVGRSGNELILGIHHADGSSEAEIDELDILRVPTDAKTVQKFGGHALRAAAVNLYEQGVTRLHSTEPFTTEIHALIGAFGKEHVTFDPPLAEIPALDEERYVQATVSIDLRTIDMQDWPKAQIFES